MTDLRVDMAPMGGFRSATGTLAIRARWLVFRLRNPALRRVARLRLGKGGEWNVRRPGDVSILPGAVFSAHHYVSVQGRLQIGRAFFANRNLYLSCMHAVVIGDHVRLGERVSIHDENHVMQHPDGDRDELRNRYDVAPIVLGSDVWIGANCVVLGGAVIGDGTVVAANSVVNGPLPANVLAAGAPARVIREL